MLPLGLQPGIEFRETVTSIHPRLIWCFPERQIHPQIYTGREHPPCLLPFVVGASRWLLSQCLAFQKGKYQWSKNRALNSFSAACNKIKLRLSNYQQQPTKMKKAIFITVIPRGAFNQKTQ